MLCEMAWIRGRIVKLAVVDDNKEHADFARDILQHAGHVVEDFQSISGFQRRIRRDTFDLVMLDWTMPEMSGLDVLTWLRETGAPGMPVIMVSSRADTDDIAQALEAGADDYVTKPYDRAILLARLRAVARRTFEKSKTDAPIAVKAIRLKPGSGQAWVADEEISLTAKEFALAAMLLSNLGRPLSRGYLLEMIWGKHQDVVTRTLDAHISKVRTKLRMRPQDGFALTTIYGYGYRLEVID